MGGGSGEPSATNVLKFAEGGRGIGGGKGEPSANCVRSTVMGLPAERLTDRTTGSTIKTARTESTMANAVFFKAVALLLGSMRRGSLGGAL